MLDTIANIISDLTMLGLITAASLGSYIAVLIIGPIAAFRAEERFRRETHARNMADIAADRDRHSWQGLLLSET